MIETVIKWDGTEQPFDAEKLNKMAEWAIQAAPEVTWSDIVMTAMRKLQSVQVKTEDIQQALINSCIEAQTPPHNKVAGRLLLGSIRSSTIADQESFESFYSWMVENGYWREMEYDEHDLERLEAALDHDTDLTYGYPSLRQFVDKYALKDEEGVLLETPQYMYMGIAMSMFENCPLEDVIMYYKKTSQQKINIPSPVLSTQRTKSNVGVSCVITTAGDSVQGIEATKHVASVATANSAGLGAEYAVRSPDDDVRKGYAKAGGQLPHLRVMDKLVKELKQSSRGGSCTVTFNCLDPELETLLNLKLKRTPETKRIDLLDYSLSWNNTFLKYAAKKKDWALVSRREYPALWEAYDLNNEKLFCKLMEEVLADKTVNKKVVNALDILIQFIENRDETGRLFRFNHTEVNNHTPFLENIRLSNLCQEIALPTAPYNHLTELYKYTHTEGDGITAQCFLSAFVLGNITDDADYEECAYIALKSLDNLMENMNYPFPQFEATAKAYRSVGVGISDLAHYMAMNYSSYNDKEFLHQIAERHYYFLLKASVRLAQERGKFGFIEKTRWKLGWTPLATYNENVDSITNAPYKYNWTALSDDVLKHGVRFSTLCAHMPCESSSLSSDSTNGLYPIREKMVVKSSKKGLVQFFAPDCDKLPYEMAYDMNPYTLLDMYAIMTKFCDQSISADTYRDLDKYPNRKIPLTESIKLQLYGNKVGIKTLYYGNTRTGRGEGGAEQEKNIDDGCVNCTF